MVSGFEVFQYEGLFLRVASGVFLTNTGDGTPNEGGGGGRERVPSLKAETARQRGADPVSSSFMALISFQSLLQSVAVSVEVELFASLLLQLALTACT